MKKNSDVFKQPGFLLILVALICIMFQPVWAKITYTWEPETGIITIFSDSDDEIIISREEYGGITINGNWLNDGTGDSIHADDIKHIVINGGPGDNRIDLSDVNEETFPNLVNDFHPPVEINGGDGNDTMKGSAYRDLMSGDAGNDKQYGGKGKDSLYGGDGDDTQMGEDGNDYQDGGDGNDIQDGGDGVDSLLGGPGNDTQAGGQGDDALYGGAGNDSQAGGDGDDTLFNMSGNGFQTGGAGDDCIYNNLDASAESTPESAAEHADGSVMRVHNDQKHQPANTGQSEIPFNIIKDESGYDTLSFQNANIAIVLDVNKRDTVQTVTAAGDSLRLEGFFEHIIATQYDDVIYADPDSAAVHIDAGPHMNGDTLYFDPKGLKATDDSSTLTVPGYAPVSYANFETVIFASPSAVSSSDPASLKQFRLYSNYPNPFNASTRLSYYLDQSGDVQVHVYSLTGQHIETLINTNQNAGMHHINWQAENRPSGIYLYQVITARQSASKKMILIK